ncbi:hypothetical protein [Methylovulum miyakonense]|uniref:hypothetical protein n=1 Tax=Methylovulum miyakonense TaxID=645578 RepID=UPI0012EB7B20|nr:hypothetical protein [Methylovulum miyakonense]
MTTQQSTMVLPPKTDNPTQTLEDRRFYTALSGADYLKLEQECLQRNTKPYNLTKIVLTLFIKGDLVNLNELPDEPATVIRAYLRKKQLARGELQIKEIEGG